jgi:hypothetical protein
VSDRLDLLKSLVRSAADRAGDTLRDLGPVATVRRALRDATQKRAAITTAHLGRAVAHAPGVRAATVAIRDGVVRIEASYDSGPLSFGLEPTGARFAPRGAKEIRFRVDPPEAAKDGRASDVAGAIAGRVAHALWGMFLRTSADDVGSAIIDRDGDVFRADLRTVPAVRALLSRPALTAIMDVLELADLDANEAGLRLTLRPPALLR